MGSGEEGGKDEKGSWAFSPTKDVSNLGGGASPAEPPECLGFGHSCRANSRPPCVGSVGGGEPPSKSSHFPNGAQLQQQLCGGIPH